MVVTSLAVLGLAAGARAQPATFDTLGVRAVLERRQSVLDSLLLPESTQLDTAGTATLADSLDQGGAAAVALQRDSVEAAVRRAAKRFDLGFKPLALTTYNRVDGLRAGAGLEPRLVPHTRLELAAAYGFAREKWAWFAAFEAGRRTGPVLRLAWRDLVEPFGPNRGCRSQGALALIAGQDRRDYLRREGWDVGVWAWRRRAARLGARWFDTRDHAVAAATDFYFLGGDVPMQEPNPAVDSGTGRGLVIEGRRGDRLGRATVGGTVGFTGGLAGGDFEFVWQEMDVGLRQVVPGGTLWLAVEGANVGGSPPAQAAAYLGGDGNLRGYDRLEFAGRQRTSARLEYIVGLDLLRRTRIPVVQDLELQFIPFFDAGTTWGTVRAVEGSRGSLEGDARSSVGLGIQRALWIPGAEVVRLDVAYRTDGADSPWGFWLRIVALDEVFGSDED